MEPVISKEIAGKLLAIPGEVRGVALLNHQDFVIKEVGKEGLQKLAKALSELGYPMVYGDIHPFKFYPLGMEMIELLTMKQLFNFDDKKLEEIGVFASKFSVLMRPFLKFFISIKTIASQAPRIWSKYYTVGDLVVKGLDESNGEVMLIVENFNLHPVHCVQLKGFFSNIVKMVVGKPVSCEETKCVHRGDHRHEFSLKW